MKISTRKDIAVRPRRVFAALADFDGFEARARAAGAEVERTDGAADPSRASWRVAFDYRGRRRAAELSVVVFDPDQQIALAARLDGLSVLANAELLERGAEDTRLFASIDTRPSTMTSRILLQTLKLARGSLERRLERRLDRFARRVETAGPAA